MIMISWIPYLLCFGGWYLLLTGQRPMFLYLMMALGGTVWVAIVLKEKYAANHHPEAPTQTEATAATTTAPDKTGIKGAAYCMKCGASLEPGSRFCNNCGAATEQTESKA